MNECNHVWEPHKNAIIKCKICNSDILDFIIEQGRENADLRAKLASVNQDNEIYKTYIGNANSMITELDRENAELSEKIGQLELQVAVMRGALESAGIRLYELAEFNQMPIPREEHSKILEETYNIISIVQRALQDSHINICDICSQNCKFDMEDVIKCNSFKNKRAELLAGEKYD